MGSQVSPEFRYGEEIFGVEPGFLQTPDIVFKSDGRMQDGVGNHTVFLEPHLVAGDAVFCGAETGPQAGQGGGGSAGSDGSQRGKHPILRQARPDRRRTVHHPALQAMQSEGIHQYQDDAAVVLT